MSELRWHPVLGQWVMTATTRQGRTFLPPKDFCPLCPGVEGGEVARSSYDIVVFENRFPALRRDRPSQRWTPPRSALSALPRACARWLCIPSGTTSPSPAWR